MHLRPQLQKVLQDNDKLRHGVGMVMEKWDATYNNIINGGDMVDIDPH